MAENEIKLLMVVGIWVAVIGMLCITAGQMVSRYLWDREEGFDKGKNNDDADL